LRSAANRSVEDSIAIKREVVNAEELARSGARQSFLRPSAEDSFIPASDVLDKKQTPACGMSAALHEDFALQIALHA
jgi:hypothetical protein